MRRVALFLTAGLLATTVSACGGSSDSADADASTSAVPTDAAVEDFCTVLTSASVKNGEDVEALAVSLTDTGSPADMTTKQRNGFSAYVAMLESIDPATTKKELKAMTDFGLTAKQEKQISAFFGYASGACV